MDFVPPVMMMPGPKSIYTPVQKSGATSLLVATILAGVLAGSALAQAPDAGCALPSEPEGIPAALDAAITGPNSAPRSAVADLALVRVPWSQGSSDAAALPSGRAIRHPMQPPAFALAG